MRIVEWVSPTSYFTLRAQKNISFTPRSGLHCFVSPAFHKKKGSKCMLATDEGYFVNKGLTRASSILSRLPVELVQPFIPLKLNGVPSGLLCGGGSFS